MLGFQIVEGMVIILLAVVGSLVIWLHLRLNALSQAVKHEKDLSDALEKAIDKARHGIKELADAARKDGPELQSYIQKSNSLLQDFDYVIDRAEKVLRKFDEQPQMQMPQMEPLQPAVAQRNVDETAKPREAVERPQVSEKQSERSVLLGGQLEQVLAEKQTQQNKNRKEDVRSTFMQAMAEREKRIEKNNTSGVPRSSATEASAKDTMDLLEGMRKTAPRSLGASAYGSSHNEDEYDDLREVLGGRSL